MDGTERCGGGGGGRGGRKIGDCMVIKGNRPGIGRRYKGGETVAN